VRDNVKERRLQLRRLVRTWPAANCGGGFSIAETFWCGSSSKGGAGDIFGLLLRWRRLACGGSNILISCHGGGRWLVVAPRGWAPLHATSTAILEMSPEREPCGGFGGPHARERGVLSGGLGPRTRRVWVPSDLVVFTSWVPSDLVVFTSSVGRLGCNSATVLGPARHRPFRCGVACPLAPFWHWRHFSGFRYLLTRTVGRAMRALPISQHRKANKN
jgi:hypothetical protein